MRNLKIAKILLSLMLMLGLTTSSFAAGHSSKPSAPDNKPKIEKKVQGPTHKQEIHKKDNHKKAHHKKDVKVVKVYKEVKPHHKPHHEPHHDKVVYYSYNNSNDIALQCLGTGLCLAVLAAALSN